MDNVFVFAAFIAVIYFIAKFIEMRQIEQESKPLKVLVKDSLLVYISVVIGSFVIEQITPSLQNVLSPSTPIVFNDNPDF
jgi:hypothetical protein